MKELNDMGSGSRGSNFSLWIAVGIAMGASIGAATDEIAIGVGSGIIFGSGLGLLLGKREKQK